VKAKPQLWATITYIPPHYTYTKVLLEVHCCSAFQLVLLQGLSPALSDVGDAVVGCE